MDLNQYNGSMNAKDCIYQNPVRKWLQIVHFEVKNGENVANLVVFR